MPSLLHQAMVELFRNRPTFAAELLRDELHELVPAFTEVRFESAVLEQAAPAEYRADLVVILLLDGVPVLAIVLEVQLGRKSRKRFTWPAYLAALRARFECPTVLLVVTANAAIARWCAQPIDLGHPGWVLRPLVLGPDDVPVVRDPQRAARSPELAVLSVIAHGKAEHGTEIARAVLRAALRLDDERSRLYSDLALSSLDAAKRRALEKMMNSGKYKYQSDFVKKLVKDIAKGKAEGRAEGVAEGRAQGQVQGLARGRAEGVIAVLEARSMALAPRIRALILACDDLPTLDAWLRRAAVVRSATELFEAGPSKSRTSSRAAAARPRHVRATRRGA